MGCLECGDSDNIKWLHWLCDKCESKYEKIGKQYEEELKNGKRVQVNRKKRSSN